GARRAGKQNRGIAVRNTDRLAVSGRGHQHHSDHRLRVVLPAPHRCGADVGCCDGVVMAEIVQDKVSKRYPDGALAVSEVSIDIADGEFIILVGPSGCGKSTTLNMVAGLEDISSGELRIDGERVNEKAPKDRDIAMVFQSYALYPHMSVRENMAFPLRLAKVDDATVNRKVNEAAEILDLTAH